MVDVAQLISLDFGEITAERVANFSDVTLDDNALHLNLKVARAAGFAGQIVHGVFLANLFEVFLRHNSLSCIMKLEANFVRPVTAGETISIAGRALGSQGAWHHIRLLATDRGGSICAVGEALAAAAPEIGTTKI